MTDTERAIILEGPAAELRLAQQMLSERGIDAELVRPPAHVPNA